MNRQKLLIIAGIIAVIVAAVAYRQFRFYRAFAPEADVATTSDREIRESGGVKHSVPLDEIQSGGPPKDGIPSIDDPEFESVGAADRYLKDEGMGIAIERGGDARFYPYQILVWHEIVNDAFKGEPLLVTYCPLCFTGMVFERIIDGEPVEFGTSGKLWNNNLVMYDRKTDSYWSQSLGTAIVGPKTGTELERVPALNTTWRKFKEHYPRGRVLSRDTGAVRDYTRDPYGSYYETGSVFFPLTNTDDRLFSKALVFGAQAEGEAKAYALEDIERVRAINDTVGGAPILVAFDEELGAVRGYERTVGGQALTFELEGDRLRDTQTGSVWRFDGEAVSGELRGETLEPFVLENHFWFSWAAVHPETALYEAP